MPAYLDYDYLNRTDAALGHIALLFNASFFYGLLAVPPIVLLFPDGRLGRCWRWPLRGYVLVCLGAVAGTLSVAIADFRLRSPVDAAGA